MNKEQEAILEHMISKFNFYLVAQIKEFDNSKYEDEIKKYKKKVRSIFKDICGIIELTKSDHAEISDNVFTLIYNIGIFKLYHTQVKYTSESFYGIKSDKKNS